MKLYTEEQVMNALKLAHSHIKPLQYVIDTLTPIKLPSDEEIYKEARRYENYTKGMDELSAVQSASRYHGFMEGAAYVINKIQGDNK